jgi:hypothetical protein
MSAVHMVAWGMVGAEGETDARTHQMLRAAVRDELIAHNMRLVACGQKKYRLVGRRRKDGSKLGAKRYRFGSGTFVECCERASKIITPSNPTE